MNTLSQTAGGELTRWRLQREELLSNLRVALPGIIQSFNPAAGTAVVTPALREILTNRAGEKIHLALPDLPDVPVVMPHGGGYGLTLPIAPGDECLVIFADMCIDAWWQSGGVQNQVEQRRHDLSDAFAIPGPFSRPRLTAPIPADALEIMSPGATLRLEQNRLVIRGPVLIDGDLRVTGHVTENVEEEEEEQP